MPRLGLAKEGISSPENSFKSVLYSENHDAAVDAVLTKMADIAAVGYSQFIWYVQQDFTNKNKMRLLWLSPPIPYGPIMINNRFGSVVGGKLLTAFILLHKENPQAFLAIKSGWGETKEATNFIAIDGTYYSSFKKALGNENQVQRVLKQFVK